MDDLLTSLTAKRLAQMVRRREVSPVELMQAHLERIEQLNPRLNAVVTLAPDALEQARRAEAVVMRGVPLQPLHGVPLTVKDTIAVGGLRTTCGSALRSDFIPRDDAPSVARLRAAGALILGKTNCSEFALEYTATNPVFGRTLNPHDALYTPGGSSGGCAAAVAASLGPASLGSDMSGSVRIPAHFCGVTALRPTSARIPLSGHLPPTEGAFSLGASLGPIARRIEDLELLFDVLSQEGVLSQEEVLSQEAGTARRPEEARARLRGSRAAWYTDDTVSPVDGETRRAVQAAAEALAEAGLEVREAVPPGVEHGARLWSELFSSATRKFLAETYAGRLEEGGAIVRAILGRAHAPAPAGALEAFFEAWAERDRRRHALVEWMSETPLLVAPVGSVAAFAHEARRVSVEGREMSLFGAFSYAQTFNVFDLPVACVPAGRTSAGLPIGVQLVGRPRAEEHVLAAARIVEEALGGWQKPLL